jgi:hypothetical protein
MAVDSMTGIVSWIPGFDRSGECSVLVRAANILGADTSLQVITIYNTTFPPVRVLPVDGDTIGDSNRLVWHPSTDPDIRGPVRYRVLLTNRYFTQQTDSVWDTTITVVALMAAGLAQNLIYWGADTMKWNVEAIDSAGYRTMYTATRGWFFYSSAVVSIAEIPRSGRQPWLTVNSPCPGSGVGFKLQLPFYAQQVTVTIHDLAGRQVAELHSGNLDTGTHTFVREDGNMPAGRYMARVCVDGESEFVPLVLAK